MLGPLLFLIYINDLPTYLPPTVYIKMYADDVKIFTAFHPIYPTSCIQTAINAILKWSSDWSIRIATSKTFALHIGNKNPKQSYYINNDLILSVDSQGSWSPNGPILIF